MKVFRFHVTYADQQDFMREIEITDHHTFEDFHQVLQQCTDLSGKELASFFICNQQWKKNIEVTLLNMNEKITEKLPEDHSVKKIKPLKPTYVMNEVRLGELIGNDSSNLIYEYDFINPKDFYIVLKEETEPHTQKKYPVCTGKSGSLPGEVKVDSSESMTEVNEKELLREFNKLLHHDPDEDENEY
ncbi:MAG: plasmid pRiA4b ORF-3 family protein [Bacteroidales bacterium]|nr:plasmid pRiA4b ORF-3 family protein [Bacteroidales bacterium]